MTGFIVSKKEYWSFRSVRLLKSGGKLGRLPGNHSRVIQPRRYKRCRIVHMIPDVEIGIHCNKPFALFLVFDCSELRDVHRSVGTLFTPQRV